MKINNIKFSEEVKIVVYNILNNLLISTEETKYIDSLKGIETIISKKLNVLDLDKFKEINNIKLNLLNGEKKESNIRNLLINIGNKFPLYLKKINKDDEIKVDNKKIFNILFGIELDKIKNINFYNGKNHKIFTIINKDFIINKLNFVMEKFQKKYEIFYKKEEKIWAGIELEKLQKQLESKKNNNDINIITDGRFLRELEEINNSKIKTKKILIIKLKNNKLDSNEINEKNFSDIYKIYKDSKNIETFLNKIKGKVTESEELSTLLTLHYYLKNKKSSLKKINIDLEKEINKKNIKIDKIIFNEFNNQELLEKNIDEIIETTKNNELLVFIANRRSGKDYILKQVEKKLGKNNKEEINIIPN